jgi:hypothetical protein
MGMKLATTGKQAPGKQASAPGPGNVEFWSARGVKQLNNLVRLMEDLLSRENTSLLQIAVIDGDRQARKLVNWPVAGAGRYVVQKRGLGNPTGGLVLAQNTPALIASADMARLGGCITNIGSNPVWVYSCDLATYGATPQPSIPQHWLAAGGGSWDLKDGNILVCSSLVAVCTVSGGSSLAYAIW